MNEPSITEGTLLGGRVIYHQPAAGYRTGLEPVLLAASIPASRGELVVEAGTGAGAGLLCLATRVAGIGGLGLEIDTAQAAVAARNAALNQAHALQILVQDVTQWRPDREFDHAFANPPWHDASGTPPLDKSRQLAKMALPALLAAWVVRLAASLRRRGTLSLIVPASAHSPCAAALRQAGCTEITLLPLWPHAGEPARLVILRGVRQGGGPDRLLPGLVLHERTGGFTQAAEMVLRGGAALI